MKMKKKPKKIFLITGEASGDILASNVINELAKKYKLEIIGVAGEKLDNIKIKKYSLKKKLT